MSSQSSSSTSELIAHSEASGSSSLGLCTLLNALICGFLLLRMAADLFLEELAALLMFEMVEEGAMLKPRTTLVPVIGSVYSEEASVTRAPDVLEEAVRQELKVRKLVVRDSFNRWTLVARYCCQIFASRPIGGSSPRNSAMMSPSIQSFFSRWFICQEAEASTARRYLPKPVI